MGHRGHFACTYFREGEGVFPGKIFLHILGKNQQEKLEKMAINLITSAGRLRDR
jgi:hypothetical protein